MARLLFRLAVEDLQFRFKRSRWPDLTPIAVMHRAETSFDTGAASPEAHKHNGFVIAELDISNVNGSPVRLPSRKN